MIIDTINIMSDIKGHRTTTTTISISKKTHQYLLKKGTKGQTFDQIITNLIQEEEENQKGANID
jgi:hypothetical protein